MDAELRRFADFRRRGRLARKMFASDLKKCVRGIAELLLNLKGDGSCGGLNELPTDREGFEAKYPTQLNEVARIFDISSTQPRHAVFFGVESPLIDNLNSIRKMFAEGGDVSRRMISQKDLSQSWKILE